MPKTGLKMPRYSFLMAVVASSAIAGSVSAQTAPSSEVWDQLIRCRSVQDVTARLSCYDDATAAFETATRSGSVVVLDRAEVEASQRQAFGFDINVLNPFAREGRPEEISSITSALRSARQVGAGQKWLVTLEDGSTWLQIDSSSPYVRRQAGQEVQVRRASLGSFMMTVGSSSAFRVRRQTTD
ncbi:hypothetical protein MU852_02310 [Brevundimonas albigilva]|uniref:Uncharacterized protein n=1 Tax=Brevundimonas albigilva TaxID=1312364 RepID=A0ABY4SQ93_9CAUL|nr:MULTISPECIES: hypothetical protein [Brevundimonas]UQV18758.1 hypothetical protein MU852_02310 [Brevundimonas albigilva]URI16454.1 hypothetical protein M8231_05600 [Brevundimonas albigilva]